MARRDEVLAQHVGAWLTKAQHDLGAADADLACDPPILDDAAFHCQQAVEKSLKAMLTAHGVVFTRTHAIEELASPVLAIAPQMEALLRRAARLTVYAWRYRYPCDVAEPSMDETLEALGIAREVVEAVAAVVGRDR